MKRFNNFKTFISLSDVLFILLMSMAMTGCATIPLIEAARVGDTETVKALLAKGADPNAQTVFGGTALMEAAYQGDTATVDVLLAKGSKVNTQRKDGFTALLMAVQNGHTATVRMLLDKGSDMDVQGENVRSALRVAALKGYTAIEQMLMKARTDGSPHVTPEPPVVATAPSSDVDTVSVVKVLPKKNAYAIVIGIEQYRQKLPKADFAEHDAQTMTEYLTKVMGYPEENVVTLINDRALKSDMEKYFEKWLWNNVEKDGSVFIYYSGHGAPNPKTGDAYLVPYDGDPSFIDQTGYSLKRLYDNLGKLQAKEIIVALDSCFSGAGGRSVIAKGARPLVMTMESLAIPSKVAVLSASSGEQISSTYEEKGHGLFTYFMLKGIKGEGDTNGDGKVEIGELFEYIKPQVERIARKTYNNEQSPQLIAPLEKQKMFLRE